MELLAGSEEEEQLVEGVDRLVERVQRRPAGSKEEGGIPSPFTRTLPVLLSKK